MKKILFSGKDVEVRFNGTIDNKKNIVIFREGGGLPVILKDGTKRLDQFFPIINFEGLFASDSINEFYVDAFHAHLYTTEEMEEAIQRIKNIILPDATTVTFGLSMGATGAVNFSKELNATFVAFAPRGAVSGILPLSNKAATYANSYKLPPSQVEQGICTNCHGYIFFDYYNKVDKIHALYIRNRTKAKIFNHPFWGHVNVHKVTQLMSLKNIVYSILNQEFDLKMLKKRMHNNYFKDSHYRYVNFIIDKYFKKERSMSLKEFLLDKIDVSNIKHLHYITEYLLKMNKHDMAFYFAKEASVVNKNNQKTKCLIFECLTKLSSQLSKVEFSFLKNEVDAYKEYMKGNIDGALNIIDSIQNKSFNSPSLYIVYATCLEFTKRESEALEIIKNGTEQYPTNEDIRRYSNSLNIRMGMQKIQKDILGAFSFIGGHIYKILEGNYKANCDCYSLFNCETKKYLRHYNGKLIESEKEPNQVFSFDSSFIIYSVNNKKIALRCSNLNLTNFFIANAGDRICKINYFEKIKFINDFSFDLFYQRE